MIVLDPAKARDWADLFAWRNDEATRAASVGQSPIALAAHLKWLEETLTSDARRLYVARDPQRGKAGMARLDIDKTSIELSLAVAPEHRGHGYAGQIIRELVTVALALGGPGATNRPLRAVVREENFRSLRAFAANEFVVEKTRKATGGGVLVDLIWRPEQ